MSNWDKTVEKARKSGNFPLLDTLEPKKKKVASKMIKVNHYKKAAPEHIHSK